jgi:hypothetical protein
MRSVWGVGWRPGDQTSNFIGKLFRPLGSAVMMVQVPYERPDADRPGLGLFGVAAEVDPATATVYYTDLRLHHEFHFVPRPGARGTVLDPTEGEGGNATWVLLGLEVDHVRQRNTERNYRLPAVPQMPVIYFGYASQDHINNAFSETPTLRQLAVGGTEINWSGDSLGGLAAFRSEATHAKEKVFNSWSADVQQAKMREAWDSQVLAPTHEMNTTGLYLIPHELVTSAFRTTRIFEYFGGLVGAHVYNPARKLEGKSIPNPAIEAAQEAGVDLVAELTKIKDSTESGTPEYAEIEQKLIALLPAYRAKCKASEDISDQSLLSDLCSPAQDVQIELPIAKLPEEAQIVEMRQRLRPHISEACTDQDILDAVRNPSQPLVASGLATIQTMRRDVHIPLADSMSFTAEVLGRERMAARFWYDLPAPKPRQPQQKRIEEPAEETDASQTPAVAAAAA